jgi:signal transduction histidine kinase/CheY-like chemotaxis protein
MATYGNFCFFTLLIAFFNPANTNWFYISALILHIVFWVVFFLTRNKQVDTAKHLFLFTTYAMLVNYDHYFGFAALTSLYYISFLPTALNIFSFNRNRSTVLFYTALPIVIMLTSNLYTYYIVDPPAHPASFLMLIRVMNMIMAFVMAVIYTSYMVFNPGSRQTRLITQSVALQTTLDNAVGAIWSIDKDYRLITVNKQFTRFVETEFDVKDVKPGFNIGSVVKDPSFAPNLRRHYERVLSGENLQEEFSYKNKVYEIKAVPIFDENDVIIGATFTSRDISYRKEAEAELVNAMLKAEEAALAKSRFLSNMSHEIRTPLNGIVGITNILMDEEHLPSQRSNFETLSNLSEHTLQLINNILDLSKIEAGKATVANERFNLLLLINKLKSVFENTARYKKINFKITAHGNADVYVKGDEVKLNQVLFNLIGNAVKFTEEGTIHLHVTVAASPLPTGKIPVKFLVEDTGIGIKKEDQEKIFESFTQADSLTTRKFGGTGLGITISEKLLNLMQSGLKLESEYGKGSRFWFTVELDASSYEPVVKKEMKPGHYELSDVNILMAEDNRINQMVAKKLLEKWKARVTVTENGVEAFDAAIAGDYDVILMDLDMPVMDGYESVAKIRAHKPGALIIALTAAAFDDMDIHLRRKGFNDVIQKPFKPHDLYIKISSLIEA